MGDEAGVGVCRLRDGVFRRIWRLVWKWNLEQTCRWSGKTPASLVFDGVQNKFKKLCGPGITGMVGLVVWGFDLRHDSCMLEARFRC